ncbi:MAG: bifunctional demethylmenaquinone methyltransferase/2-methoxy-6-polyprenyl-1,4-benzoquinol methylase UbiE [Candidatus Anammoxibacter sp.]
MATHTQEELLQKEAKNIKNMFSSIARFYDFLNRVLSFRFDQRWRKYAVKVSEVPSGAQILDVCSGTGDLAIAYSKILNGKGKVTGSDFCHDMLKYGGFKIAKRNLKNKIQFTEADTLNLPFRDNQFQVAAVAFGIRNVANLEKGVIEMSRVVAKGGKIVILEFSQPTNPLFRKIYYFYFSKVMPAIGNMISSSEDSAYTYLPKSVLSFPDRYSLKVKLEKCGLKNVEIYSMTFGIVTIHVGTKA